MKKNLVNIVKDNVVNYCEEQCGEFIVRNN